MTPEQTSKLSDIQNMALDFNKRLQRHAPDGGCLFLGRFYAESRRIFPGLNPGGPSRTFNVNLTDHHGYNPPFHNPDPQRKDNAFWRNCEGFLALHPDLRAWFLDGVTSTNLVPWRTGTGKELRRLNHRTGQELFRYSGQLLTKMIEHHDADLLIISGKESAHLLNELVAAAEDREKGPWTPSDINSAREGPGGTYQWRRLTLPNVGTVLQIPHFSRAKRRGLDEKGFADWLRVQLRPFGLAQAAGASA